MEKKYITQEQHDLYKKFLTKKDFIKVSEYTQYSVSTVHNIYNMRTKLNRDTEVIVHALNIQTAMQMLEFKKVIDNNIDELNKSKKCLKKLS